MGTTKLPDGIRLKLEWTKEHISRLRSALIEFGKTNPYVVDIKHNPYTRQDVYYMDQVADTPSEIPLILCDILHNMASTLDHIVYQLFLKACGSTNFKDIGFPIATDKKSFESPAIRRKVNGIPAASIDAINTLEPYKEEQAINSGYFES